MHGPTPTFLCFCHNRGWASDLFTAFSCCQLYYFVHVLRRLKPLNECQTKLFLQSVTKQSKPEDLLCHLMFTLHIKAFIWLELRHLSSFKMCKNNWKVILGIHWSPFLCSRNLKPKGRWFLKKSFIKTINIVKLFLHVLSFCKRELESNLLGLYE